jgi:acyl-CoA thioester hydrolase
MSHPAPFVWQSRVRFVDTDASGRIHYTSMFRQFEAAEAEFFRSLGLPYTEIGSGHLSYPRVHVECDYLAALRDDDLLFIEVSVVEVGRSSFTLQFRTMHDGVLAARGKIVIVCMDRRTQRSHPLPGELAGPLREQRRDLAKLRVTREEKSG